MISIRRPSGWAVYIGVAAFACTAQTRERAPECIAPANAGGGWDLTCRSVGRVLSELDLVDGTVRVINMPGAGGGIAYAHTVTQRATDRDLLVAASPSTTLNLALGLFGSLSVDDVRWVAAVGAEFGALAVRQDARWSSLNEFVDEWRANPKAIVFGGGSAVASQDHMKVLLLAREAGIDPRHVRYVPFDGGGEALATMLGGFVDVFSGEASELLGHLEAGTVRILTVMARDRLSGRLASVPTARESGYPVEWVTWRGLYAPAGTPDSVYDRWVDRMTVLARSDSWERARVTNGLEPFFLAGAAFQTFVGEQVRTFRQVAGEIGLR